MKQYFHGATQKGPYFEGWYLKLQTRAGSALALIPALHIDGAGRCSASLQVITGSRSWWLAYAAADFQASEDRFFVRMGSNSFGDSGLKLNIERPECALRGSLTFGPLTRLRSDIMGPFRLVPHMECAHGVISMEHGLEGMLEINGERFDFSGGTGYIETDRGHSFPDAYLWTQCAWQEDQPASLMLSVATIPLAKLRLAGCICAVIHRGREYRLATYCGASVEEWSRSGAVIRQGKYRLEVEVPGENGCPLRAPVAGSMQRTIRESLCTGALYRFREGRRLLFEHVDRCASFEFSDGAT